MPSTDKFRIRGERFQKRGKEVEALIEASREHYLREFNKNFKQDKSTGHRLVTVGPIERVNIWEKWGLEKDINEYHEKWRMLLRNFLEAEMREHCDGMENRGTDRFFISADHQDGTLRYIAGMSAQYVEKLHAFGLANRGRLSVDEHCELEFWEFLIRRCVEWFNEAEVTNVGDVHIIDGALDVADWIMDALNKVASSQQRSTEITLSATYFQERQRVEKLHSQVLRERMKLEGASAIQKMPNTHKLIKEIEGRLLPDGKEDWARAIKELKKIEDKLNY